MRVAIFSDFDDTITRVNVTDTILEKFADPLWRDIQEDWLAGKLTGREVLEKQMPLITARGEQLDQVIDAIEVDPFFSEFAAYCAGKNHPLYILSDGFDYWIERILRRALPAGGAPSRPPRYFSCGLNLEGEKVEIAFPYFPQGCAHGCATCKPALFEELKKNADKAVVIGDGLSDLLLAKKADLVLAKNGLREYCEREGIPSRPFGDFRDVARIIRKLEENRDD